MHRSSLDPFAAAAASERCRAVTHTIPDTHAQKSASRLKWSNPNILICWLPHFSPGRLTWKENWTWSGGKRPERNHWFLSAVKKSEHLKWDVCEHLSEVSLSQWSWMVQVHYGSYLCYWMIYGVGGFSTNVWKTQFSLRCCRPFVSVELKWVFDCRAS